MSLTDRNQRLRVNYMATAIIGAAVLVLVWGMLTPVTGQEPTLNPLGIEIVGPRELLAGSRAALRVVVTDHQQHQPAGGALVSIRLSALDTPHTRQLFVGRTDTRGTLQASFAIPNLEPGSYDLIIRARYNEFRDSLTQRITLKRVYQVLLTTDKPIYQPAQLMHIRALALKRPDLHAVTDTPLTLEVADARGNKVFKQTQKTNDFGIAAVDFQLADEVNMGRYTIRAIIEDQETEKKVTVKRYVLPKFKVTLTTDRDYYLPGEQVEGTVQADYFFGKPVAGGDVQVTVKTFDVDYTEISQIQGKTNSEGTFDFEVRLPTSFVGQPLEQGKAFLEFEVKITDAAEHSETIFKTSTVAASHIMINAVPESGNLVPNLENRVYIMTTQPDGTPISATIESVQAQDASGEQIELTQVPQRTDEMGMATVVLQLSEQDAPETGMGPPLAFARPRGEPARPSGPVLLKIQVRTVSGFTAAKEIHLPTEAQPGGGNILLRTEAALYAVGDSVLATALTMPAGRGTVYFDVVKDRQTMLTRAADIKAGRAEISIPLSQQLSGTIYLSAYRIMPSGQIVRDTRPLYVEPATELNIGIDADKDTYLPGGEATLNFTVTNSDGQPVAAALGINVVDEAVFALQELQPGMERVYFYLEKELMTPRFEIHGLELPGIIISPPGAVIPLTEDARKQQAAQFLFAAADVPELDVFQADSYAERLTQAREEWAEQLRPLVEHIGTALRKYISQHDNQPPAADTAVRDLLSSGLIKEQELQDPWGNRLTLTPADDPAWALIVFSAGPDGERDTEDDFYFNTQWPQQDFDDKDSARQPQMMWRQFFAFGVDMEMAEAGPAGLGGGLGMLKTAGAAPGAPAAAGGEMPAKESVRIREYFPETLFFEPALITDGNGRATLTVPMADSITTWRLAALANSAIGQLGSTTKGLRCFQDFFIDIDLPVALTQNDQVSIPVAVYNYLPTDQKVRIELTKADWFKLTGNETYELNIKPNEVTVRYFTITARELGSYKLTVHGLGTKMSDAISRDIRIEPDGKKIEETVNDRLTETVTQTLSIPEGAIDDASKILVKIYPGIFSQAVEGLDSMLRMPFGCFEQTSSVTYPNVLVMDYMKSTNQINPEIQMKAEGFINTGYQRLVSYEVDGGGFSWFGDAPANKILTAYGLMLFHDMDAVHPVDASVISRTQQWLVSQQEDDGSWKPDEAYLHQESWGRIQAKDLPPTAYVTWGLAWSEYQGAELDKAVSFVRDHAAEAKDPYVLSMVANALIAADMLQGDDLDDRTIEVLDRLRDMAKTEGEKMWWETNISGITHSTGKSADLEGTGMAAIAFIKSARYPQVASRVLNYLISQKDANGTWHSTNATILALRALLLAQKEATTAKVDAHIAVHINGQQASTFHITRENSDVLRQVDCQQWTKEGENEIEIRFEGEGSMLYQIVSRYYLPWKQIRPPAEELLAIDVDYDKTKLAQDDIVTAHITVRNNTPAITSMIIVDLGIPPGFQVQSGDLAELVGSKVIDKYKLTGRQIIVYLEKLAPRQVVKFSYRLKAKFPIKAKTPKSTVYEYYNPDNRADAKPIQIEVTGG